MPLEATILDNQILYSAFPRLQKVTLDSTSWWTPQNRLWCSQQEAWDGSQEMILFRPWPLELSGLPSELLLDSLAMAVSQPLSCILRYSGLMTLTWRSGVIMSCYGLGQCW